MITRDYPVTMARYNAWQNSQFEGFFQTLDPAELTRERGAFFGSILKTLSHLVWGDTIWMSRFDQGPGPSGGIADSTSLIPDLAGWRTARRLLDRRIQDWAEALGDDALAGDLTWFSGAAGREVSRPLAQLIVHFFNHQTHHRGQIHAMLTASGSNAPVSDLFLMPGEIEWF